MILGILLRFVSDAYMFFDQYLVANVLAFVRGFKLAIIMMAAVLFLLIAMGITIRQVRLLPKTYSIDIRDLDGRLTAVDGLRQKFSTFVGAESYARYYRAT